MKSNHDDVLRYKSYVEKIKKCEEIVTLREWFDTTSIHQKEMSMYISKFKNLARLGRELHNRNIPRVTERFGDEISTHVEATYKRGTLDSVAPLCALACCFYKKENGITVE